MDSVNLICVNGFMSAEKYAVREVCTHILGSVPDITHGRVIMMKLCNTHLLLSQIAMA